MKTTTFLPMAASIKIVTIIATIIILLGMAMLIYMWFTTKNLPTLIVAIVLFITLAVSICMIPQKVVVKEDGIDVHMLAIKVHVPAEEVVSIEHYPRGIESYRIVGMGMYFGNIGLFSSSQCGKHFSLVTNPLDVCVLVRKTKMPIVMSVADKSVFSSLTEVKEKN